jgi:hypothetical protein
MPQKLNLLMIECGVLEVATVRGLPKLPDVDDVDDKPRYELRLTLRGAVPDPRALQAAQGREVLIAHVHDVPTEEPS